MVAEDLRVKIKKDGPYIVSGGLPLMKEIIASDSEGNPVKWMPGERFPQQESFALCRCGQSKNKPYCDGTHANSGFNGTETAERKDYLTQVEKISGPALVLTDSSSLCASARFCHQGGGTWKLVANSDDPKSRELAIEEAGNCPSGRLVVWDVKTEKPIEPDLNPSISLVEDPDNNVSGPVWLKGSIPVESSDGTEYEIRNRATLCRCGQSKNKPFCDGSHIQCGFNDGDESLKKRAKE